MCIRDSRYTSTINKKLSRIFDSIQYQDFAITFRADNAKGDSFEELNNSLNAVDVYKRQERLYFFRT